jgi:hypothetical protein
MHIVEDGHATALRVAVEAVEGMRAFCCDHADPFQCIASGDVVPSTVLSEPTATQFVVLGHDTLASVSDVGPPTFGLATTLQPVAACASGADAPTATKDAASDAQSAHAARAVRRR